MYLVHAPMHGCEGFIYVSDVYLKGHSSKSIRRQMQSMLEDMVRAKELNARAKDDLSPSSRAVDCSPIDTSTCRR